MPESRELFNPFPGLRPFQREEDHLFFGRDGQSGELLRRLRRNRFVAVVGSSGSGKSSLVRAGLLPALHGGFMMQAGPLWKIAVFRPGSNPIGNLSAALSSPGVLGTMNDGGAAASNEIVETTLRRGALGLADAVKHASMATDENLLIVVDQFEEIFRFKQSPGNEQTNDEAAAFVKLLLEATKQDEAPIYVVLTMRSDYVGDCAQFRNLPEAVNEGLYLIPRMTRDQRRAAIAGPVAVGGAQITPRLLNLLLNDVGDNPDQLPLLQHALMRTWDYWYQNHEDKEPIDLRHYESIGGMADALSKHADEAYNELTGDRSREIAEKLFKCLTEKGADNREVRRPTEVAEVCAIAEATGEEVAAVVESFRQTGRSFLMPPPDVVLDAQSLIDISHESLIRGWQRLGEWVGGEALSAGIYRRVAETAVLYHEGGAALWGDPDLQVALGWREKVKPNKAWAERYHPEFDGAMKFLDDSKAARDARGIEEERQRKRELRRTRASAAIFALAFFVSLAAVVYAFNQRSEAMTQGGIALAALERTKQAEQEAINLKDIAEEGQRKAEEAKRKTEEARDEAVKQKNIADRQTKLAVQKVKETEEANRMVTAHEQALHRVSLNWRRQNLEKTQMIGMMADAMLPNSTPQEAVLLRNLKAEALATLRSPEDVSEYNTTTAITETTKALETEPENPRALLLRSYFYTIIGEADKSISDLKALLRDDPKSSLLLLNMAVSQGMAGDFSNAVISINQAIDYFSPGSYESLIETAVDRQIKDATGLDALFVNEKHFRQALYYEQASLLAAARNDGFFEAMRDADKFLEKANRGRRKSNNQESSIDAYLVALNWAWYHLRKRPQDYGVLASQAYLWECAGYHKLAEKKYDEFLKVCKASRKGEKNAASYYDKLALWLAQKMKKSDLRQVAHSVGTQLHKEQDVNDMILTAQEMISLHQLDAAMTVLTDALKKEPDNVNLLISRAAVHNMRRKFKESGEDADRAIELSPDKPLAKAHFYSGLASTDPEVAEKEFRIALEHDPNDVATLNFLAAQIKEKKPEEAITLLDRRIKVRSGDPDPYFDKAKLENRTKRHKDALRSIAIAIAIKPDRLEFYDERANIERDSGRDEGAVTRNMIAGYKGAALAMSRLGRRTEALDAFSKHTFSKALEVLAAYGKTNNDDQVQCEMAITISEVSRVIEVLESRESAIEFWRTAMKAARLTEYQEVLRREIQRLSGSSHPDD